MEDHEGEQEVIVETAEDRQHHGGSHGEAFLGAAENDGDAVCSVKAQDFTGNIDTYLYDDEQRQTYADEGEQMPEIESLPVALHSG